MVTIMMKIECAWCKADLGEKEGPEGQVTHSICKDCQIKFLEQVEKSKKNPKRKKRKRKKNRRKKRKR